MNHFSPSLSLKVCFWSIPLLRTVYLWYTKTNCTVRNGSILQSPILHFFTYTCAILHFSNPYICSFTMLCFQTAVVAHPPEHIQVVQLQPVGLQHRTISFTYIIRWSVHLLRRFITRFVYLPALVNHLCRTCQTRTDDTATEGLYSIEGYRTCSSLREQHYDLTEWLRPKPPTNLQLRSIIQLHPRYGTVIFLIRSALPQIFADQLFIYLIQC